MYRWVLAVSLATVATFVGSVPVAHADVGKAVVVGIVRDAKTGKPVEGALIVVTSTALQGEESVLSDSRGLYRIPNLPPGVYTIQVLAQNYEQTVKQGVKLRSDARIRVDAGIRPSAGAEDVRVVVVPAPTVDIGSSTVGQTMDEDFSRRVPVVLPTGKGGANRSFESVAEATPGASSDTYGTSIAGTTSPENQYTIDGMNVGDAGYGLNGTPLSVEFLKEVRVDAGGYMPEFGRSTGGVLNAVTKTGSNEFHGGVWASYLPGQLEGKREVVQREGSTVVTEPSLSWIGDIGFDLGGPIKKDKLWFYAGFSAARSVYDIKRSFTRLIVDPQTGAVLVDTSTGATVRETLLGTDETRKAQATSFQAIAKLTAKPAKNHTVSLTGIVTPTISGSRSTYSIDPQNGLPEVLNDAAGQFESLAHTQDSIGGDAILTWNASSKDKSWSFDTTVGYHYQRQTRLPVDGSSIGSRNGLAGTSQVSWRRDFPHSITEFEELSGDNVARCSNIDGPDPKDPDATQTTVVCPVQNYTTGGPGFLFDRRFHRVRARHMVTWFKQAAGHHEVKFGLDGEFLQYGNERGYSGQRILRESTAGSTFLDIRQYGVLVGPDENRVFDSLDWTSRSVVLGAFVQDSWAIMDKVTVNLGLRYDAQLVYGGDGELVISLPNQISPRAGVIWDPTQNGRSKIFGSWGRFFQTVPLDIADRAGSGEPLSAGVYEAPPCDPRTVEGQRGECRNSDNLVQVGGPTTPDQDYLVLSTGKTPVDPDLRPQSQDELILGGEYEVFDQARVSLTYQRRWLNRAIEDMSRDEATTYFIGNPGEGIASDFPKAKRTYDALIVQFQKGFSEDWLIAASYTASWLRGNIAGLFRPETGQLDPFINSDFDLISLLPNRNGYLPGDRRHAIKVFSAGEVRLSRSSRILLGGAFRATSGGPTNYLGSHPLYGPDEVFILPRGSGPRLPWVFRVDTSFGYQYNFNDDVAVALTVNVFNVLNLQAAIARDNRYTNADVLPIVDGDTEDLATLVDESAPPPEEGEDTALAVVNPNFGRTTAYQSPRQFSFGVRVTF